MALAGCVTPEPAVTSAESPSAREYPTGSHIPRKNRDPRADGVSVYGPEALERMQNSAPGGQKAPGAP